VVDDFTYTLTQSSNAGCINDNIYFSSITNPPGAYQYTWSPATYLNSTTIPNPIVTPTTSGSVDYAVQILGPTGCTKYDTLSINVAAAFKPDVTLMVNPTNVVCGDSVFLDVQLNGGSPASCGPSANNSCVAPSTQHVIGNAVGINTTTSYPAPFANWYRNAKHQFLFTAAELNSMGITGGKLTEIAWEVFQINGTVNYNQYTVKLGCTSQTALTNTWVTGLTTVFTPQNIVITTGWNTLPFTAAYEWDGLSNIVVEICYNNLATNFTQNSLTPFTSTPFNSSTFYFSDATPACPSLAASAGSPSPNRPITRFGFCPTLPDPVNYTFQWTPASSIDNATAQTTFALPQNNTTFQLVTTFINGGCTDTSFVNVTVNCCETPLINSTNITCFGGNNGQIEVTPISTTLPPYTVQLIDPISSVVLQSNTNVNSSATFSNLIAGNYLVSTIDANGCIADTLVSLSEPNLLSISISNDTNICVGDSVQLSAFGGAIYSWSPITNLSNPTNANTWYTGTTTQLFTVLVTDTNGCSNSDSVLITVNPLPNITLSNDTTICEKDTLQLLASGGTVYNWTPSSSLSNSAINNPVAFPTTSTTYQVVVTSSFGCKDSASVSLIVQTLPNIVASSDVSICLGDTTQLTASGGLNYTWQPALNLSNNLISNPLAWPTTTTEYIVVGEDALGCINSDSVTITVNTLPTINAGIDVWLCPGSDIQLTAIGTGNFSWTPTIGLTDPTISNPLASPFDTTLYIVELTDNNGCKNSDSISVFVSPKVPTDAGLSQTICEGNTLVIGGNPTSVPGTVFSWTPTGLIVDATLSNPTVLPTIDTWFIVHTSNDTCNGVDSVLVQVNPYPLANAGNDIQICVGDSVQLNATGGVGYTWLPNQDISNPTINNPTVWPADTTQYIVTVTDINGCVQSDSIWIIVNPLPTLFTGNDEIICINDSVQLNAIGTGNFSWSPTNFMTNNNLSNPIVFPVLNTTYTVVLTDSNGCVNSDSLLVTVNNLPPVNAGIDVSICFNDSIQLQASGAVNYNWLLADGLVNTNISNPFASPNSTIQYIVFGTDANLCTNSDTVQVTVFNLPIIDAGNDVQICIFDTTQLAANGGISYTWSPTIGLSSTTVSNPFANPTATQEYIVEGMDANNCFNSDTLVVTVVPLPIANAGVDVKICLGDTTQLTATGGVVYSWSPMSSLSNSNADVTNAFPDTTTQYIVTVTDVNVCTNYDTVTVEVFRIATINDTTICLLDSVQLDVFGSPGVLFSWTPIDYLSDPTIANPIAKPIENTTYTVSVTDIDGCQDQASVTITVNELPKPLFSYTVEPGCEELIVHFKDSSTLTDTYSWNFGNGAISNEINPTINFTYNQQYQVELVASNNFGCTAAYVTTLTAEDFEVYYSIYIPNVFTPNGDGENDAFFIDVPGKLYDCLDFRIYNRWGQLIYKSVGDALNWDGKSFYGDSMPDGTYFFTVEIKDKKYSGTINLFR
jgi:gliding motility-associated-like protein